MTKRENIWNVPNVLTMIRLALIGVFVVFYVQGRLYWAMATFIVASLTDFLDGFIARRYHLVTNFGKLMDPLADKLMLITALVCLTVSGRVPLWLMAAIIAKELLMVVGAYVLLKHGVVVQAKFIGKLSTVVFMLAVIATFLNAYTAPYDTYLQFLAFALSLAAMFWYLVDTVAALRKHKIQA